MADGFDAGDGRLGHPGRGQVGDDQFDGRVEVVGDAVVGGEVVHHPHLGPAGQQLVDHVGADEAGTAGDQDPHASGSRIVKRQPWPSLRTLISP